MSTEACGSVLSEGLGAWLPIATAPRDGKEVLAWRDDAGCLLVRWTAPIHFMTTEELDAIVTGADEWQEQEDWFYADFIQGGRLDGSEAPTHWMPLPAGPAISA